MPYDVDDVSYSKAIYETLVDTIRHFVYILNFLFVSKQAAVKPLFQPLQDGSVSFLSPDPDLINQSQSFQNINGSRSSIGRLMDNGRVRDENMDETDDKMNNNNENSNDNDKDKDDEYYETKDNIVPPDMNKHDIRNVLVHRDTGYVPLESGSITQRSNDSKCNLVYLRQLINTNWFKSSTVPHNEPIVTSNPNKDNNNLSNRNIEHGIDRIEDFAKTTSLKSLFRSRVSDSANVEKLQNLNNEKNDIDSVCFENLNNSNSYTLNNLNNSNKIVGVTSSPILSTTPPPVISGKKKNTLTGGGADGTVLPRSKEPRIVTGWIQYNDILKHEKLYYACTVVLNGCSLYIMISSKFDQNSVYLFCVYTATLTAPLVLPHKSKACYFVSFFTVY